MAPMVQVQEDMGNGAAREGGEVLDGLHLGVRPPYFPERGCPRPAAQLRPFHGHGVHARRLPKGAFTLPKATDAPSAQTARASGKDAGGQDLHRVMERRWRATTRGLQRRRGGSSTRESPRGGNPGGAR